MPRFSYLVVPVMKDPSTGKALTGRAVSLVGQQLDGHALDEVGGIVWRDPCDLAAFHHVGHLHLGELLQRTVDGREVPCHDDGATLSVGLLDRLLDAGHRLVGRQDSGQGEEAGLHHRVDAAAHALLDGDPVGVDHPELHVPADEQFLDRSGEFAPDFVGRVGAVEQEGAAFPGVPEHVHLREEAELVTGDEVGALDEVAGADRVGAHAQVRDGDGARLPGVVDEVPLRVQVGVLADDLDGTLAGADGPVRTRPEEHRLLLSSRARVAELRVRREAEVRDIVGDPDGEVAFRVRRRELVEDRLGHPRVELLRRQAVAAADHPRQALETRLRRVGVLGEGARTSR